MNEAGRSEPVRLLLVEDDPESSSALTTMLRKRGLAVTAVASAEEALRAFEQQTFDAIVADIRLERMSGVGLLRCIRERNPEFPVVLLTGYDSLESAIQAVRLGAHDYILKPLESIDDLLRPVLKAVDAHRLLLDHRLLQERLRALASELVLAEERERRRLAEDIHDSIGQFLAICKLKLDVVASRVHEGDVSLVLDGARKLLTDVIAQTRSLTFQLSPAILYDVGLEAAVDELCTEMEKGHGLGITFHDDGAPKPITEDAMVLLFRAVRELLFNVVKHAHAKSVRVFIERRESRVMVRVEDDGVGFSLDGDGSRKGAKGFGLFSIRQRLQNLGGDMDLASGPGQGTRVSLEMPLSKVPNRLG
jgi:signal transduction histidine kinase